MFASSRYPLPSRAHPERSSTPSEEGEGRRSESSRRATWKVLLPNRRPGWWLVLLAGCFLVVVLEAFAERLG